LFLCGLTLLRKADLSGLARICQLAATLAAACALGIAISTNSDWTVNALVVGLSFVSLALNRNAVPALDFMSNSLCWLLVVGYPLLNPTDSSPTPSETAGALVSFHILTAVAGEALCLLSFSSSLLYIWAHRQLKNRVLVNLPKLPSLEALDKLVERSTLLGLLLLTISLISGLILMYQGFQTVSSKILWAFTVWIWYVFTLFSRGYWDWSGLKSARMSFCGATLLIATLFGTIWK
jgi:ABC-type uncharacterized transport system permease subunit